MSYASVRCILHSYTVLELAVGRLRLTRPRGGKSRKLSAQVPNSYLTGSRMLTT